MTHNKGKYEYEEINLGKNENLVNSQTFERSIILIEMPWGRDKDPRVPLGHGSLLSALKKFGNGKIYSIVSPINDKKTTTTNLLKQVCEINQNERHVDLAIGVYVWCDHIVTDLLNQLKKSGFNGRIILGGPQISYTTEGLEDLYPEADIFVRGYGEMAIVELFNHPNNEEIFGVHFAGKEDLNLQTEVELTFLPSPWLNGDIDIENQKFIRWETQRGCPFNCSFCQHKEAGLRLKGRRLDEERIVREIDLFCEKDVEEIAVLDPIFNSKPLIAKMVLNRFIENGFGGKLALQCRAEMCDDEFLEICSQLNVKLEFGLQTIHSDEYNAVKRPNNMRKINEIFDKLILMDIEYEVSIIFGLPNQTLNSFIQTVEWCLEKKVPVIKAFPLMLLRGTEVEKRRAEWGLIESEGIMPVVQMSNTFSYNDWIKMSQISETLKITEGKHPKTIDEVSEIASSIEIDMSRFQPNQLRIKKKIWNYGKRIRNFSMQRIENTTKKISRLLGHA